VQIGDAYYVFGHRQTNAAECSRQGVAEKLPYENGRFLPAEMTSQGLYGKPLPLNVTYEAGIACVLYGKHGAVKTTKASRLRDPYITQTGHDREERPEQYVANVRNGSVIGYRYFDLSGARAVRIRYRGCASGKLLVCDSEQGDPIAQLPITPFGKESEAGLVNMSGVSALFFRFEGAGRFHLFSFIIMEKES
jgi:hypothetical protein